MAVVKRIAHKNEDGNTTTYDIGVEAKNVTGDSTHRLVTDSQIQSWNNKQNAMTVDASLSPSSSNPIQNKAVHEAVCDIDDALNHLDNELTKKLPKSGGEMTGPLTFNSGYEQEAIKILNDGGINLGDGWLVAGYVSVSSYLSYKGKGILFDSGMWTPALYSGGTPMSVSNFGSYYTRFGNKVFIKAYIGTASSLTPTAQKSIGLPFAPASANLTLFFKVSRCTTPTFTSTSGNTFDIEKLRIYISSGRLYFDYNQISHGLGTIAGPNAATWQIEIDGYYST